MKFIELYEALTHQNGSYVDMKFSEDSLDKLMAVQRAIGLDNPTPRDKMHVTLMYSKKPSSDHYHKNDKSIKVKNRYRLEWFGPEQDVLVLVIEDDEELQKRHAELRAYGMQHSYDEFTPHVTLAYNQAQKELPSIEELNIGSLKLVGEDIAELDLNWKEKLDD